MVRETIDLIRNVFGRDVAASLQEIEPTQRKSADALLHADFYSGNFNSGGEPDNDPIPSDAFGDW